MADYEPDFDNDWAFEEAGCPQCLEINRPLGALGKTLHYNCQACGWWYSKKEKGEYIPGGYFEE